MSRRKLGLAAAIAFIVALVSFFVVMQHHGECFSSVGCTENYPTVLAAALGYLSIVGVLTGSIMVFMIVLSFPRASRQRRLGTRMLVAFASLILVAPLPLLSSSWIFGSGPIHWTHPSADGGIQCDGPSPPLRPTDPPGTIVTLRCIDAAQLVWNGLSFLAGVCGLVYAIRPRKGLALSAVGFGVAAVLLVIGWNRWGNTPRAQTDWVTLACFVLAFAGITLASVGAENAAHTTQN